MTTEALMLHALPDSPDQRTLLMMMTMMELPTDGPGDISLDERAVPFNFAASVVSGIVCFLSVSLLVVAAGLAPDSTGVGTHTQLGMAPCGFLDRTGLPCATCGMTTSFAMAADGDLIGAFLNQPAGAALALGTAIVALLSGWAMIRGVNLLPVAMALWRVSLVIVLAAFVLGAWGFKIFTMHGV